MTLSIEAIHKLEVRLAVPERRRSAAPTTLTASAGVPPFAGGEYGLPTGAPPFADEHVLARWSREVLAQTVPHEAAIFGFGGITAAGLMVDGVLCVNLAEGYIRGLTEADGSLRSPPLHIWYRTRQPLFIAPPDFGGIEDARWRANFTRHGFRNALVDACQEVLAGRFCFITLFNVSGEPAAMKTALRQTGTIEVRRAWMNIAQAPMQTANAKLPEFSAAEQQLLEWLHRGKSNGEIAQILGKSVSTIKAQLEKLYAKTGTSNRTQLAAVVGRMPLAQPPR